MSQSKLAKLCPLSQPMLSNIINNRYVGKIGKEKCQEFGLWYLTYRKQHPEGSTPEVVPNDRPVDGRLTFHPTKELPVMRDWFHSCRNPSRRTLQMYVDILNQGPVRQQESVMTKLEGEKEREREKVFHLSFQCLLKCNFMFPVKIIHEISDPVVLKVTRGQK
ncbi:DNA-binding protein SATB2, partial [Stegodyphus mimosarum]